MRRIRWSCEGLTSVHNKYTGYTLKHLLLRHMYNLPLLVLLCYAQALCSETSYCYCCVSRSTEWSYWMKPRTVLCGALYTACVDASRMVFWDRSQMPWVNTALLPTDLEKSVLHRRWSRHPPNSTWNNRRTGAMINFWRLYSCIPPTVIKVFCWMV